MPIQLTCTACSKKMQVADQYAGRRVSCPGCKTILVAPGSVPDAAAKPPEAQPKSPVPPPEPAAKASATAPSPPKASPPTAPPARPPVAAPAKEDEPFSFGKKKIAGSETDREGDDETIPPARSRDRDEDLPPSRNRDDDDEEMPRRKRSARSEVYSARRTGVPRRSSGAASSASRWNGFAGGCALAWWGLWLEFLSLVYGLAITGYLFLSLLDDARGLVQKIRDLGGPSMYAPVFVGTVLGSLLTFLGRMRMLSIPPRTGAKKVFVGAWLFTGIRLAAVFSAAVLITLSSAQWMEISDLSAGENENLKNSILYFVLALGAFAASLPFWFLADLSTIPAIAIVGGAIPSLRIRRQAGLVTFIFQGLILLYVFVSAGGGTSAGIAASHMDFSIKTVESEAKNKLPGQVSDGNAGVKALSCCRWVQSWRSSFSTRCFLPRFMGRGGVA